MSDGCHGNKENSIFAVITNNREIQYGALSLYVHFVYDEQPLKNFSTRSIFVKIGFKVKN